MVKVFIGWDSREPVAYEVCKFSIERHTNADLDIIPLKHIELRKKGFFSRPWLTESTTGLRRDLIDNKEFSTEFSHTRFLVPALCGFTGWALFMDCDMIFTADIKQLMALRDDKYAAMVVKHNHRPKEGVKMDEQPQRQYFRKNWSSFVLWNCGHPKNALLTQSMVNSAAGSWLHSFNWLDDIDIGSLGHEWNWIEESSPMPKESRPKVIHYTNGGPWFETYRDVAFGDLWTEEYERWRRNEPDRCGYL